MKTFTLALILALTSVATSFQPAAAGTNVVQGCLTGDCSG